MAKDEEAHLIGTYMYRSTFGTERMREVFSEEYLLQKRLDVEAILAQTQAELGIIPLEAAQEIARRANITEVPLCNVKQLYEETGQDVYSLARALSSKCEGEAGEYVHYGTTTQDITITSLALQLKEAIHLIRSDLRLLLAALLELIREHRAVVMVGRSHEQAALPITFGYKAAMWSFEIMQSLERLQECSPRVLVGSMGGAIGSQPSLGPDGQRIQESVMEKLGLEASPINVQPSETRYAEFVNVLGLLSVSLSQIANEIANLQKSEIMELEEPFDIGRQIGSSTLPHKRNPEKCELIKGMDYIVKGNVMSMLCVRQKHERDATRLPAELCVIPETCLIVAKMLDYLITVLEGLVVRTDNIEAHVKQFGPLMMSESLMFTLARKTGQKQKAYDIIHEIAMEVFEERREFSEVVLQHSKILSYLTEQEIRQAMDPSNYLGTIEQQIDNIVDRLEDVLS